MDYKERYTTALERARERYSACSAPALLEYIFPELKESEGEKIRKDLIEWIEEFPDTIWRGHYKKDVLAWLEMQGEQTNVELGQSEATQTSDQELELKFHPGDWIINNEYGDVLKVTKADAKGYEITNQDEEIFNILKEDVECNFRLWTIADAKDGDLIYVSTDKKGIQAIFHEYKNDTIFLHCYLCADFVEGGYIPIGSVELTYPLQKIHYNSFFEKMHKAGYEWDNDKKELKKKIEPKFHPGDWIVDDETPNDVFCVIEVLGEIYKVIDTDGNDYHIPHCKADNQFHLWSINYAKDGDVLASELTDSILLFRGIKDNKIDFYCDYDAGFESPYDKFGINDSSEHYGSVEESQDIHPATREQRETLIKAMANAGYTFDFEKKELKKIESKKLDPDKVIEWMKNKFSAPDMIIEQLKEDFEL